MDITQIVMYIVLFLSLYFEVFLLITFFERSESKEHNTLVDEDSLPTVAVIVPCFNEETTVAGTLRSLLALSYPSQKLQIIAVNDGSTDGTREVLEAFRDHEQIQILNKENGGKHTAMNAALAHTQADVLGCLDADSFVEPDALIQIIRHFEDSEVAAVTPSIKVYEARGLIQTLQKAEYGLAIFVRNVFARMDSLFITPGPFSFFRRSVINEVGPWQHGHSTEDLEMCLRLQRLHKKVTNEPNAIVYTKTPKTLPELFKQRLRWTYGFLRNAVDYQKLFLNPKYGTLGMLVLPMSLFSLFGAVFLFSALIWNVLVLFAREFVRFQTVGLTAPTIQFDMFFINTSSILTITIALVVLTLVLMGLGKRLARDSYISLDMPIYLVLYGFITPLWLTAALYKAIANTGVRWR
ncbi:glycosyltransferase [Candidatus Kaiserbacteria bacterium]|nr:MAG: glycosyltransferase [Candidatus Kaiserbacteria bacterium]